MRPAPLLAFLLSPVLLALPAVVSADFPPEVWLSGAAPIDATADLRYRLLLPPGRSPEPRPLVVLLHGPAGAGTDNSARGVYSFSVLTAPSIRLRYPAFVLTPQLPVGRAWIASGSGSELDALSALIDGIVARYRVDPGRIYLAGESSGADAVWRLLAARPERFAAGISMGGDVDPREAALLADVPLWIFHGRFDDRVPVARSRAAVSAIWDAGGNQVRYTELRDTGHTVWAAAWQESRLAPWLFSQTRE